MAAITTAGHVEYEGQVVTTDIDICGIPGTWSLGEMYFIIAENPQRRGLGNTVYNFRRVYVNQPEYEPLDIWQRNPRVQRINTVYKEVKIDAERAMIEFYENAKACDNGFRNTLINWAMTTEPLLRRDVLLSKEQIEGYIFKVPERANQAYVIMDLKDGEMYRAHRENIQVLNPKQYLTYPMTCLECHNVEGQMMTWVSDGKSFNRPLCGLCVDYYLDNGILDFDRESWDNVTGPYVYGEDQPATCIEEPGVTPLHSVRAEQQRSRTEQRRRNPLRRR